MPWIAAILLGILAITALSGITYGPVAALLSEMFPPAIRYSSLSIPYHLGTGYFGGFLPFISQYIVAKTGDPFAGDATDLRRRQTTARCDQQPQRPATFSHDGLLTGSRVAKRLNPQPERASDRSSSTLGKPCVACSSLFLC